MKRILVDMDDVLAQTSESLVEKYNRDFKGKRHTLTFENFKQSIHELPSIDDDLRKYLFEAGFFRNLKPKPDSQAVMKELSKAFDVFIVSAAIEFPLSMKEKLEWLSEHFESVRWERVVFCGDKSVTSGDYMIDDISKNLEKFNGRKILFSAPHNTNEVRFERVSSWKEIYNLFFR